MVYRIETCRIYIDKNNAICCGPDIMYVNIATIFALQYSETDIKIHASDHCELRLR